MPTYPLTESERIKIQQGRVIFAHYVQRKKELDEQIVVGGYQLRSPTNEASVIASLKLGEQNTTLAEYNAYLGISSSPSLPSGTLQSKNNITDGGFTVGGEVNKDMNNTEYTDEFDPANYVIFFPDMAPFTDENIIAGDKDSGDRLIASYWNDLGNDIFDSWGYFYIYDVESQKYYFPLLSPQNQEDGVITTQTFFAFSRTFTIKHGWTVQGIFKFDISVNDTKEFRFGAYGNMGSDGDENISNLTYSYTTSGTNLTLYYQKHQEDNNTDEILYSYFIPKVISQNNELTYIFNNDGDDNSLLSKTVTNGLLVYFSKTNDVKEWVANDLEVV
jgi:hypothetical protein